MKFPFVKRTEYEDLKKELDVALEQMKKMETIIEYIDDVCTRWQVKKVGNLRAISTIVKLFNPKDSGNET